jgi:hypothetical protein
MKRLIFLSALGLALLMPKVSEAANSSPANPKPPSTAQKEVLPPKQEVAGHRILLCYTCGNNFPYRIDTGYLGGYNWVWEYGPLCTNPITYRWDNSPQLCSN